MRYSPASGFVVASVLLSTAVAHGQIFSNSSSGGSTRATSGARPSAPRNARVADERGNAADAVGNAADTLTPKPGPSTSRVAGPLAPIAVAQGEPSLGRISRGSGVLPNDGGQVWREYDLAPYTSKLTGVAKPEQAVIDWILRETGTEVWFGAPLGILSADKNTLRVYHTPEIQETVKGIYDRFLATSATANRLHIRVVTINNPNWRSRAMSQLKPVEVKSTGVDAWLVSRENAAALFNELRQRVDFRERTATVVDIPNGQTHPLGTTQKKQYTRSVRPRSDGLPGFEPEIAALDEGFSLSVSPLTAVDGKSLDVVVKCNIDQIEKIIDVPLDLPAPPGQPQRMSIQVPQVVSWRLHERFRWPSDHVLLLSCGVVATPTNEKSTIPLVGSFLGTTRADALLLIEPISGASPAALPTLPATNPLANPFAPMASRPTVPFTASPLLPPSRHHGLR